MTGLTHHTIKREDGYWVVAFPRLEAWFDALPDVDPEEYRTYNVDDLTGALAYAAALAAISAVNLRSVLDFDDCDAVLCSPDDSGAPQLLIDTDATSGHVEIKSVRDLIAHVLERAADLLDGGTGEHGSENAAERLIVNQRDARRRDVIVRRVEDLTQGDRRLLGELWRQLPSIHVDLDAAEAVIEQLESSIRAAVVERVAAVQTMSNLTPATEGIDQ